MKLVAFSSVIGIGLKSTTLPRTLNSVEEHTHFKQDHMRTYLDRLKSCTSTDVCGRVLCAANIIYNIRAGARLLKLNDVYMYGCTRIDLHKLFCFVLENISWCARRIPLICHSPYYIRDISTLSKTRKFILRCVDYHWLVFGIGAPVLVRKRWKLNSSMEKMTCSPWLRGTILYKMYNIVELFSVQMKCIFSPVPSKPDFPQHGDPQTKSNNINFSSALLTVAYSVWTIVCMYYR